MAAIAFLARLASGLFHIGHFRVGVLRGAVLLLHFFVLGAAGGIGCLCLFAARGSRLEAFLLGPGLPRRFCGFGKSRSRGWGSAYISARRRLRGGVQFWKRVYRTQDEARLATKSCGVQARQRALYCAILRLGVQSARRRGVQSSRNPPSGLRAGAGALAAQARRARACGAPGPSAALARARNTRPPRRHRRVTQRHRRQKTAMATTSPWRRPPPTRPPRARSRPRDVRLDALRDVLKRALIHAA